MSVFFFCFFFVFSLQYSEKALYNQLSFYRFIFDWEYATTKVLLGEEKCKMASIFNPHYKRARTHTLMLTQHRLEVVMGLVWKKSGDGGVKDVQLLESTALIQARDSITERRGMQSGPISLREREREKSLLSGPAGTQ